MKRLLILVIAFLLFSSTAQATLIDNLDGTVTQIRDDVTYGDGSILTWLKDANTSGSSMTWATANTWIDSLNSSDYLGYNDWRLPNTLPVNGTSYNYTVSFDGSTDDGFNITSPNHEMAFICSMWN